MFSCLSHSPNWKQIRLFYYTTGLWQCNVFIFIKRSEREFKSEGWRFFKLTSLLLFLFAFFFSSLELMCSFMLHPMPSHDCPYSSTVFRLNQNMDEKAAGWSLTWTIQNTFQTEGSLGQQVASGIHWSLCMYLPSCLLSLVNRIHHIPASHGWHQSFTFLSPLTLTVPNYNAKEL